MTIKNNEAISLIIFMITIEKKVFLFNTIQIHSAEKPFDIKGYDVIIFQYCKTKINHPELTLVKPHNTIIIDLSQDLTTIRRKFHPNNKRLINKAKKEGITIHLNKHHHQFYQLYLSFLKQKNLVPFHGLFNRFGLGTVSLETMKNYGTLLTATYENELLTGAYFLESSDEFIAWIGASKRLQANKQKAKLISCANRRIIWKAIQYAKQKGIKEFDLGGIFTDEEVQKDSEKRGIRHYKMQFGGLKVTRYQYKKINSKTYKILEKILTKTINDRIIYKFYLNDK